MRTREIAKADMDPKKSKSFNLFDFLSRKKNIHERIGLALADGCIDAVKTNDFYIIQGRKLLYLVFLVLHWRNACMGDMHVSRVYVKPIGAISKASENQQWRSSCPIIFSKSIQGTYISLEK